MEFLKAYATKNKMILKYKTVNGKIYENIEPVYLLKLSSNNRFFFNQRVLSCIYNNKEDYFLEDDLYSDQYNSAQVENYINSLQEVFISDIVKCREINNISMYRYYGTLELYKQRQELIETYMNMAYQLNPTTTLIPATSTSTTLEPCSYGLVLSRVYNLNTSGECAICEPTEEFTCMSTENANKEDCEFQATQLNFLSPICDTTPPPPI